MQATKADHCILSFRRKINRTDWAGWAITIYQSARTWINSLLWKKGVPYCLSCRDYSLHYVDRYVPLNTLARRDQCFFYYMKDKNMKQYPCEFAQTKSINDECKRRLRRLHGWWVGEDLIVSWRTENASEGGRTGLPHLSPTANRLTFPHLLDPRRARYADLCYLFCFRGPVMSLRSPLRQF